jgi:hypothetical protein
MRGRSFALLASVGLPTLFYFGAPLGERTVYKPLMYAPEIAALKNLQIVNTAQVQFNSQFGRFAKSLAELGSSASGEKFGYKFTLAGTPTGYTVSAVPSAFGSTGSRTFYSDQSLVIRENYGQEPATANSKEVGVGITP